jgi:hypothetical protein
MSCATSRRSRLSDYKVPESFTSSSTPLPAQCKRQIGQKRHAGSITESSRSKLIMSTATHSSPVAIITGAASGVGAATAKMLAAKGYQVLVNYNRSADLAKQVVQDCLNLGVQAMAVQGDVSDDAVCIHLANQAMAQWGRIDVLVNSAGATLFVPLSQLDDVQAADFQKIYAINAIGPFQMSRAVAKHMGPHWGHCQCVFSGGPTGHGQFFSLCIVQGRFDFPHCWIWPELWRQNSRERCLAGNDSRSLDEGRPG